MKKDELLKKINKFDDYLLLEDPCFSPLEVYLFVDKKCYNKIKKMNNTPLVCEEATKILRVYQNCAESSLISSCLPTGKKTDEERKKLSDTECQKILEFFGDEIQDSWFYGNLQSLIGSNGKGSECSRISLSTRVKNKLRNMYITHEIVRGRSKNDDAFLQTLEDEKIISTNFELQVMSGKSSSCYVIDRPNDSDVFFVKGNDSELMNGICNEIQLFEYFKLKNISVNGILYPVQYNKEQRWIKYCYKNGNDIESMLEKRKLTQNELNLLGEFLVEVLDFLYKADVIHCDLRPNNLVYDQNDSGEITKFYLTDLGCCSIAGSTPWKAGKRVTNIFMMGVGGTYRYNKRIIDDAASAFLLYRDLGCAEGNEYEVQIRNRIGRLGLFCQNGTWQVIGRKEQEIIQ